VQDVDRDVVLQKFDAGASSSTTTKGTRSAPVAAPPTDEELFLSFVGSARTSSSSSSSSSRTESGPVARLSLRGASGDVAARRLCAFLDESVRAGALSVVVEVDAGSDQALDVARGHAAVLSVRDAAAADGGKGARVVRFKT
jgi:hypothetical protein